MKKEVDIIDIWAVNQGENEYGSGGTPAWFFEKEQTAKDIAKGRGSWGGNAQVTHMKGVNIAGEVYLLKSDIPIKINVGPDDIAKMKKDALAKLTDTEKDLLGLK